MQIHVSLVTPNPIHLTVKMNYYPGPSTEAIRTQNNVKKKKNAPFYCVVIRSDMKAAVDARPASTQFEPVSCNRLLESLIALLFT